MILSRVKTALAVNWTCHDFAKDEWSFCQVLPFKMANVKPPIFVLKKMIYPLEGFPRDPPQQFETDSEMLVRLH